MIAQCASACRSAGQQYGLMAMQDNNCYCLAFRRFGAVDSSRSEDLAPLVGSRNMLHPADCPRNFARPGTSCTDTPHWSVSLFSPFGCSHMNNFICRNGAIRRDKMHHGSALYNHPEKHCCSCGSRTTKPLYLRFIELQTINADCQRLWPKVFARSGISAQVWCVNQPGGKPKKWENTVLKTGMLIGRVAQQVKLWSSAKPCVKQIQPAKRLHTRLTPAYSAHRLFSRRPHHG